MHNANLGGSSSTLPAHLISLSDQREEDGQEVEQDQEGEYRNVAGEERVRDGASVQLLEDGKKLLQLVDACHRLQGIEEDKTDRQYVFMSVAAKNRSWRTSRHDRKTEKMARSTDAAGSAAGSFAKTHE